MKSKALNFSTFILTGNDFSDEEQERILKDISCPTNRKILSLVLFLFLWSIGASFIESTLLGGGIVFSAINGLDILYFLPELAFLILNFLTKFIIIRTRAKDYVSFKNALYASVPTFGPILFLGRLFRENTLLLQAIKKYFVYRKRYILKKVL